MIKLFRKSKWGYDYMYGWICPKCEYVTDEVHPPDRCPECGKRLKVDDENEDT